MRRSAETDAPDTPRAAGAPSRDTERDLAPPDRDSGGRGSGRPNEPSALAESTLLSLEPAPELRSDGPDPKLEEIDRRLRQIEARLHVLELGRVGISGDKRWLFWVGLLLALVLGWQLRAYFR
jgi:hypothetical protein